MNKWISETIEKLKSHDLPDGYKKENHKIIPEVWNVKSLVEIVEFLDNRRRPIKESEREKGPYPYYGASGIIDYVNDYIFDGDFILLGEDGANILTRTTALAYKASGKIWVNNHAHILSCKEPSDINFIMYALELINYEKYNASTAQPKITKEVCKKLLIAYPQSSEERKKVGDIISTWDKAIELKEKLIEEKIKQKSGLMQKLLTGKVRLPGFDGEWDDSQLKDHFGRVTRKNPDSCQNVLTISAQKGLVNQEDYFNKSVASSNLDNYFLLKNGEFAYNKSYSNGYPMGAIKRLNGYDEGVVTTLYICFHIKNSEKSNGDYFEHYFDSGLLNTALTQIAHEGGRAHGLLNVSPKDFFDLKVIVPPCDEQKAIASVLNTTKKEADLHEKELEALKQQKKGLMQLLLTGIVRVNVETN